MSAWWWLPLGIAAAGAAVLAAVARRLEVEADALRRAGDRLRQEVDAVARDSDGLGH